MMSRPPCKNCQSPALKMFEVGDLNRRVSAETFSYFRCPECGLIFVDPVPDDLGRFYPPDYYGGLPPIEVLRQAADRYERYKVDMVKPLARGDRLLEIGPGGGGFAYLTKEAGFRVHAIEMGAVAVSYLREVIGVEVVESDDTVGALRAGGTFDVICAWHVIEHLVDPWTTIEAAVDRLNPGGLLVLAAPNPASLQFKVLGGRWAHVYAPRHLQLIPIKVLHGRIRDLGLESLLTTTNDPGAIHWNRFGYDRALAGSVGSDGRSPARLYGSGWPRWSGPG